MMIEDQKEENEEFEDEITKIKKFKNSNQKEDNLLNSGIKIIETIFSDVFCKDEIKQKLQENKFEGIYIAADEDYKKIYEQDNTLGGYEETLKIIILNKNFLKNQPEEIVTHELLHAFFNGKLNKKIKIDYDIIRYGIGVEEGIISIATRMKNIKDNINNIKPFSYQIQANIIKQINILYESIENKKYKNIIELALKEPDNVLYYIFKMYKDLIIKIESEEFDKKDRDYISKRMAFDLIKCLDLITEKNPSIEVKKLLSKIENINSLLIINQKTKGKIGENSFILSEQFNTTIYKQKEKENQQKKLLIQIFGEKGKKENQKQILKDIDNLNNLGIIYEEKIKDDHKILNLK